MAKDEDIFGKLVTKGEDFVLEGNHTMAEEILIEAYEYVNWREKFGGRILPGLAYCIAFKHNKMAQAKEILDLISEDQKERMNDKTKDILAKVEKRIKEYEVQMQVDEQETTFKQLTEEDPQNLQSKFDVANYLFQKEKYEEAIEYCMSIMKADKNWQEKKAYNLLLEIFKKLGNSNPVVSETRKKLSKLLF